MPPDCAMYLSHIEPGQVLYRSLKGMPPKFHARLKHNNRTLSVLQGDSEKEAGERAKRLADVLYPSGEGITIEPA